MDISFDKKEFFSVFIIFICIVFLGFILQEISQQLTRFFLDQEQIKSPSPPLVIIPQKPLYVSLGEDALVYSTSSGVLAKKEELIQSKNDFLFVDLSKKNISVFGQGAWVKDFSIKAIGKSGSFFETPNGSYRIRSKEKNHFSTIGEVWMPWSMHFFGNYFIHGWPYYPSGKPVAAQFSGGCIRLGDNEAKELFSLTSQGMPVLVYTHDGDQALMATSYFRKIDSYGAYAAGKDVPIISALSGLAVDLDAGMVLFEKNKDNVLPMGSLAQLMTGLVAVEAINRFKVVAIPDYVSRAYARGGEFIQGEEFESQDLLYPLLLGSHDSIATFYNEQVWGFVQMMNEKARAIGLTNTQYNDVTGMTGKNNSTATDIFKLIKFIYVHKKPLFDIMGASVHAMPSRNSSKIHIWRNTTWPEHEGTFIAGKAGVAGDGQELLAAVFRVPMSEGGERSIAIILLSSENRIKDTKHLIDYLKNNFVYGDLVVSKEKKEKPIIINTGANVFEAWHGLFIK